MLHPITLWRHPVEYFLEDSDLEGLSDITVSSVHTSDLSSFEGESEDEGQRTDSSEEGELPADGLYFSFLFAKKAAVNLSRLGLQQQRDLCLSRVFGCVLSHQMMGSAEIRNKAAEKEMKTVNLVARPTFTSPSSTPVTIATLMTKSPWRSAEDPQ